MTGRQILRRALVLLGSCFLLWFFLTAFRNQFGEFFLRFAREHLIEPTSFLATEQLYTQRSAVEVELAALKSMGEGREFERTLDQGEIYKLLARQGCGLLAHDKAVEQLATEGIYTVGTPSHREQDGAVLLSPQIWYDAKEDRWYLSAGGFWQEERSRRELGLGLFASGEVGGDEEFFVQDLAQTGESVEPIRYYTCIFDTAGEVTENDNSALTIGFRVQMQDEWQGGYNIRQFATVLDYESELDGTSGELVFGYIHTPVRCRIWLSGPINLGMPEETYGLPFYQPDRRAFGYYTNEPEQVFIRFSDSIRYY